MDGLGKGVFRRKGSRYLWIRLHYRGKAIQESTKEVDPAKARAYLRQRQREIGADRMGLKKFIGPEGERLTMAELLDNLKLSFERRAIKSLKQSLSHIKRAKEEFGDVRAHELTAAMVDEWYQEQRALKDAPEDSTLNRAVSMLASALRLAKHHGKLNQIPVLTKLSEAGRARRGFFERADFEKVVERLPEYLQDFARFGYCCGWRAGAIRSLLWSDVDLANRVIRLRPEHDKIGEGQVLGLVGELWEIISRRVQYRACDKPDPITQHAKQPIRILSSYVFHRNGLQIGDYRKAWASACRKAGVRGRKFHDLRRTLVRNAVEAGNDPWLVMQITGHKTLSTLNRYNIKTLSQQREALEKTQAHLQSQPSDSKILPMSAPEVAK